MKPSSRRNLPKSGRVDATMSPYKESSKAGLCQHVQDAVESGFRVGWDNVATFAEAPCYGVEEPERKGPNTAEEECAVDVAAKGFRVLGSDEADVPYYEEECGTAKRVEPPLSFLSFV